MADRVEVEKDCPFQNERACMVDIDAELYIREVLDTF